MTWSPTRLVRRGLLGGSGVRAGVAVLLVAGLGAGTVTAVLAASGGLAAPTLTSKPANPSKIASAAFSYSAASGATFECALDTNTFKTCQGTTSGSFTSSPLPDGSHTFQVRALSGKFVSSATSYTWSIDTQAPATPGFTTKPASLSNTTSPTFGFSDTDASAGFLCALDSTAYNSCTNPQTFSGLAQGGHSLSVKAIDPAGNQSAGAASYSWTIDSIAPPAPVLTQYPPDPTTGATQNFAWTESESGTTFQCSGENGVFGSCTSPSTYTYVVNTNNTGQHQFAVRAYDTAGNYGEKSYSFKVTKDNATSGVAFAITGSVSGLAPGLWRPIALHLTNPNSSAIYVTSIAVTVSSSPSTCASGINLDLRQSAVSTGAPIMVPANAYVDIASTSPNAPQIQLKNLPTNQDACKGASFTLAYTGSAHN